MFIEDFPATYGFTLSKKGEFNFDIKNKDKTLNYIMVSKHGEDYDIKLTKGIITDNNIIVKNDDFDPFSVDHACEPLSNMQFNKDEIILLRDKLNELINKK
jgi:hypothetical protein